MGAAHNLTGFVTLFAVMLFFWTTLRVSEARRKYNIPAPATTGSPDFERVFRVQMNTLEGLAQFLPALWLCSLYLSDVLAAALGVLWLVGRVVYVFGYSAAADKRGLGFGIQGLALMATLFGALFGLVRAIIVHGLF